MANSATSHPLASPARTSPTRRQHSTHSTRSQRRPPSSNAASARRLSTACSNGVPGETNPPDTIPANNRSYPSRGNTGSRPQSRAPDTAHKPPPAEHAAHRRNTRPWPPQSPPAWTSRSIAACGTSPAPSRRAPHACEQSRPPAHRTPCRNTVPDRPRRSRYGTRPRSVPLPIDANYIGPIERRLAWPAAKSPTEASSARPTRLEGRPVQTQTTALTAPASSFSFGARG